MNLDEAQAFGLCAAKNSLDGIGLPCHTHRRSVAMRMGNLFDLANQQPMPPVAVTAPAEKNRHRFLTVAGEKMGLQATVLIRRHRQSDGRAHFSNSRCNQSSINTMCVPRLSMVGFQGFCAVRWRDHR